MGKLLGAAKGCWAAIANGGGYPIATSCDSSAGLSSGRTGLPQQSLQKPALLFQSRRCIWLKACTQSWRWRNNFAFYLLFAFFLCFGFVPGQFSLLLFLSKSVKRNFKRIFAQQIILLVPGLLPAMTNSIHNMRILCVSLKYLIILLGLEKFICDPH